jgi:hypothetical protein
VVELRQNDLQHAVRALKQVIVPEAEDGESLLFQVSGSPPVPRSVDCMLPSVDLDNQASLTTNEVADEWANWRLAAELESAQLPPAQMGP